MTLATVGSSGKSDIESLQWLRFIAAAMVAIHHTHAPLAGLFPGQPLANVTSFAAGVDLFFVISGFVMVLTTYTHRPSAADFMRRRIVRIVPLYWLFTALMVLAVLIIPSAFQRSRFELWHTISSFLFMPTNHPVLDKLSPILVVGWTLNYEMFFYFVFAATLAFSPKRQLGIVAVVFVALTGAASATSHSYTWLAFWGSGIVLEFLFGMIVALAYFSALQLRFALVLAALACCAALFTPHALSSGDNEHYRFIFWGLPAFGVVLAVTSLEKAVGWPRSPQLRYLGDASYSIYLSHLFTLGSTAKLLDKFRITGLGVSQCRLLLVASTLLAGAICYRFVERPMHRALTKSRSDPALTVQQSA
jgi:exopolysaccharide production protein ExoZ